MASLSEHEKRQFHLIAQRLQIEDPKFFKAMRLASMWHRPKALWYRPKSRNLLFSIVAVVLGVLLFCVASASLSNPQAAIPFAQAGILVAGLGFYSILTICRGNSKSSQPMEIPKKNFIENLESKLKASYQSRWDALKKNGF